MGNCCCGCTTDSVVAVVTASARVPHVKASAQVMWDTIADLEGMKDYMEYVDEIERINQTRSRGIQTTQEKTWQEGTMWKETRTYQGNSIVLHKTITKITTPTTTKPEEGSSNNRSGKQQLEPQPQQTQQQNYNYSVCINVSFPGSPYESATNTSTLTVMPLLESEEEGFQLIGSLAVIDPVRCCWDCCRKWRPMGTDEVQKMFQSELQDMASEAERRYAAESSSAS